MSVLTKLERTHFFNGRFLTAEDLSLEQSYFLEKLRRNNRYLHGWGVVNGLTVQLQGRSTIIVDPGMAVDCSGNEILLGERAEIQIPADISMTYVVVQYLETKINPISSILDSNTGEKIQQYLRIQEGYIVDISEENPNANHIGLGPGTLGCGYQHPIAIACLNKRFRTWRIILMGRR